MKGFAKDKGVAKINKGIVEMDENDIKELLEVVSEGLTNEELLELECEHIAGKERERKLQEKKKRTPQENWQ